MTRGRKPLVALREAKLIAKKRGETQAFMYGPGTICNFVIYCICFVAFVRIKRITRVHCSHAWIEGEAADALAALRAIAAGPGISRELWVFLPRGASRFFRVEKTGLVELSRDGSVMPEKPGPEARVQPAMAGQAAISSTPAHPPEASIGETPSGRSQGEP